MLRSGASRGILRSLNTASKPQFQVTSSLVSQQSRSQLCTISRRPQLASAAKPLALQTLAASKRWQTKGPMDTIDKKHEQEVGQQTIPVTPGSVSATSSMVAATDPPSRGDEKDPEMLAGIKADLQTIRETFSLEDVPKEAYWVGMAGVLPYAATSLSTVYCAWEINHAAEHGSGLLMSGNSAELLLHIIEPLQVGYGAVILSFLGAIHWGFEWAGYGGHQGYPRYAIGVISTAVAWPTILMPVEYALITQFLAFNFLYYTDVRAKTRGWAPAWYGIYRFVLTFIVGSSIVISLIGRGQIAEHIGKVPSTADRVRAFQQSAGGNLEEEEESARRKYLAEEGSDEEEGGDDDEE